MSKVYPSLTMSGRATLIFFVALVVGAIALLSLAPKPAESQQASTQQLYEVHDLGTLAGGSFSYASGINDAGKVVGNSSLNEGPEGADFHAFLYSDGAMHDLGTLPGGFDSGATDINDADKVVGSSATSGEEGHHAFLYSGGIMNDLGTLGGPTDYSFATAINNADKVVGVSSTSGDPWQPGEHAFFYSDGVMKDVGTLGGSYSAAWDINEAGKVVGSSYTGETSGDNPVEHAFLYGDGVMKDLGTLAGHFSRANGINDADKVVGSSSTSDGGQRAFLYSDGVMKDLGTLEGRNSYSIAFDINNADQVVGYSINNDDGVEHPFLYSDGAMRDLNSLLPENSGWQLFNVETINDNGYIVGRGVNSDGKEHAFLLKPHLDGFYQPVDNLPTVNKTKPGKTIPIRFSWGMDQGLDIFAEGYPKSEEIPCDSTATVDGVEETSTGKGGLTYNASTDSYEYAWATNPSWSGCRQFVMKLKDGTVQQANFIFR